NGHTARGGVVVEISAELVAREPLPLDGRANIVANMMEGAQIIVAASDGDVDARFDFAAEGFFEIGNIGKTGAIGAVVSARGAEALVMAGLIKPHEEVAAATIAGPAVRLCVGIGQGHQRADVVYGTAALDAARLVTNTFAEAADSGL